jgi:hypothetical protein
MLNQKIRVLVLSAEHGKRIRGRSECNERNRMKISGNKKEKKLKSAPFTHATRTRGIPMPAFARAHVLLTKRNWRDNQ